MLSQDALVETFSFPADTSHLEALGSFIQANCADHPQVILLELAVTEVVTNAIRHGQARQCRVSVSREEDVFCIAVEDDGLRFDSTDHSPQPMGDLREGGYGIAIIKQTTKSFEYSYQGGWNRLKLTFQHSPLIS